MPLYERVKGFFVQLVLGGTSAGGGGSSIGCIQTMPTTKASSPVSHNEHKQQQHRHHHSSSDSEYFDIDDDDDDFSSAEYEHIFAHAAGLGLAGFAATAAANLLFGGADDKSHSVFAASPQRHHLRPQPTVSLQASLLELLAMETSPTRQSGGGGGGSAPATVCNDIGAAVDRYLSVLARGPAKPPASRQSLNEPQFVQTSATSLPVLLNQSLKEFAPDDSRLAPKKPLKRKHYLRSTTSPSKAMAASNQQQHASSSGSSSTSPWSRLNNAPDAASGSSPPTTMKSLSTLLNAKPIKSAHTNKNRREKERQTLTRYIHDDLNEEAKRKWRTDDDDDGDGDDDDAVAGAVGHDADTVDCAFFTLPCTAIRQSVPDVLQMAADAAVAMSIGCRLSPEDFPAIPGPKKSSSTFTATTTKSKVVLEDSAAMHIESASVTITVTASTTPARSQKPAISWEISVDELRSPAKRPAHASRQQRRDNDAAAAAMPLTSDQQHGTSSNQPQPQQQQCLLKMLLGIRPRERQISECSDDFICFEKDSSEGSICYDVADDDDSSEFETDDDDDADDTDDDVDDDDDEETEADDDNNDADDTKAEIKTNAVTDTDSESDSESESEANSGTQQPDSGFEEKRGNKVRPRSNVRHTQICRVSLTAFYDNDDDVSRQTRHINTISYLFFAHRLLCRSASLPSIECITFAPGALRTSRRARATGSRLVAIGCASPIAVVACRTPSIRCWRRSIASASGNGCTAMPMISQ